MSEIQRNRYLKASVAVGPMTMGEGARAKFRLFVGRSKNSAPSSVARESPTSLYRLLAVFWANVRYFLFMRYSWMALAAFLPAPIALMTVASPVTMSPPV